MVCQELFYFSDFLLVLSSGWIIELHQRGQDAWDSRDSGAEHSMLNFMCSQRNTGIDFNRIVS